MKRLFMIIAMGVVAAAAVPRDASACTCVPAGPPCEEVFRARTVFVGTVTAISEIPTAGAESERSGPWLRRRVHFRVTEPFRGDTGTEVDVLTGSGGGDCGYAFTTGHTYLVYTYEQRDQIATSICTRTRPIEQAAEDLAFLRAMSSAPSAMGRIVGLATYTADADVLSGGQIERRPFAGAHVSFTSGEQTLTATSDAKGEYAIDARPGEYAVSIKVPSGFYAGGWRQKIVLEDTRGCASADVFVRDDGHIRGRVIDAAGKPVPNLAVELGIRNTGSRIQWDGSSERTDADGRYEFTKHHAGEYIVGVNASRDYGQRVEIGPELLLPGVSARDRAAVLTLPSRTTIEAPDFILPDSARVVQITGVALDPSGTPAEGVRVYLEAGGPGLRLIGPAVNTNRDGRFAFAAMDGVTYKIVAEFPREPGPGFSSVEFPDIHAAADLAPLALQLIKR
jgi:5-hydroxyisourate hydrolase-like protein (transthyretin family)